MGSNLSSHNALNSLIKALIQELGISQKDLGKSVGMSPSHISLFLNGKLDLQSKKFTEILSVLGIDLEKILSEHLKRLSPQKTPELQSSLRLNVKLEHLSEDHRAPLLKIIESLAG